MKNRFWQIFGIVTAVLLLALACDNGSTSPPPPTVQIEMVQISDGSMPITFGSGSYRPYLTAFKMGKYQVTQEQYFAVMGNNPSGFTTGAEGSEVQGKRPVEQVSWYDAILFCNRLSIAEGLTPAYSVKAGGTEVNWNIVSAPTVENTDWNAAEIVPDSDGYRLPTEAQWIYACRADSKGAYSIGAGGTEVTTGNLDDYAWYDSNSNGKTHEVGKKTENAYGLYDMHGNVLEWCWDWFGEYPPDGTPTDPTGAVSGTYRVACGGCWLNLAENVETFAGFNRSPYDSGTTLGFRLAHP